MHHCNKIFCALLSLLSDLYLPAYVRCTFAHSVGESEKGANRGLKSVDTFVACVSYSTPSIGGKCTIVLVQPIAEA